MAQSKKVELPNPKNEFIKVYVNGEIVPREEAKVSVFDSVVQGGDSVWEGLRLYEGKVFMLDAHLERLMNSAKVLAYEGVPTKDEVKQAIIDTLKANEMYDDVHMRLTLTRGKKVTSGMNPKWNQYGCTLIVLPEWKAPIYRSKGLKLVTSYIRRNNPQFLDSKIHHNNLLNNIQAKIEANFAGVDGAVMLDMNGFLSETNSTNIFLVKKGKLYTPFADSCLPGITRNLLHETAADYGLTSIEKNLSITEMYTADEMFTTGTEGEIAPVYEVDGRVIGDGTTGPISKKVQEMHLDLIEKLGEKIL
ncbi:aminotransferase class IV [Chondrinema litorale]|uniref:aminotransferase class IV n=1 Tax=Chondrinema litorale TaxID=2994555 RepID=UPI0025434757|nr:aminotransferase class IV [Chondrinema litorale]UZR92926.1 aminotransferase class IV [Chondrinema litorale]